MVWYKHQSLFSSDLNQTFVVFSLIKMQCIQVCLVWKLETPDVVHFKGTSIWKQIIMFILEVSIESCDFEEVGPLLHHDTFLYQSSTIEGFVQMLENFTRFLFTLCLVGKNSQINYLSSMLVVFFRVFSMLLCRVIFQVM